MRHRQIIVIRSTKPPLVEIDSVSRSAYVRFKQGKVARTESIEKQGIVVTLDFDASGDILGVEVLGVCSFRVDKLLQYAPVEFNRPELLRRADYVPARVPVTA